MQRKHNPGLVPFAKDLRKNMTREERHLWYDFLKADPVRFQRQKIIANYIVDFYCAEATLIVELDGSQHFEADEIRKDAERTAFLEEYGLRILRIPNIDISRNFQSVCEYIDLQVKQRVQTIPQSQHS